MTAYSSYRSKYNLLDNRFILMCDKFNYTYHKIIGDRMEICYGTIEEILADDTIPKKIIYNTIISTWQPTCISTKETVNSMHQD